ncbi:acyltransferase family protein [Staphylococcus gallinarum]|uniref:acyltransferase family protein n=1 Tax=Staphylococcus gallinarum TaxID=1293 RepID=UPI001E2E4102|nr:acyltransferase family protein [Staphylococcus gallinarum]MCD8901698.1 acetyltransferase [Staphylococcus gallinarum]MEB6237611.1 acetyltransferase [Staphylococcus gallinarum]
MNRDSNLGMNKHRHARYMPGLDGLRAIAVLAIIIYHLNKQWLTGGFLGVDTFFVISGYLITSLLLKEFEETGSINLKQFWLRRMKRLIPAVFVLVGVVSMMTLILKPDQIVNIKHDAFAAIFYVSNWWYIMTDVNYFEQFAFMPLKHLWSLAIEEQFYIIFPIVLITLLLTVKKYRNITLIFWIVSLVSLLLMVLISEPHMEHSRVYFGTDTRLQTMLLGVLLAFLWPPFKLKANPPRILSHTIDGLGIVSTVVIIMLFIFVDDNSDWIYNGGFYVISVLTLFVILSVVHPSAYFAKVIGNPLFVYIGKRSYSLYLWHFPVISFIHSYYVEGQIPIYVYVLDIITTLILAELSYRYIETPFRKYSFKAFSLNRFKRVSFVRTVALSIILVPTVFIFAGAFDQLGKDQQQHKPTSFSSQKKDGKSKAANNSKDDAKHKEESTSNKVYKDIKPLLIGDSVMVDIGEYFTERVPNAEIDGKVGRNLYEATPLIQQKYESYNKAGNKVVLELGTNGDFSKAQLNELISQFDKADIYLVNTRVPRGYESHVNKLIADAAKEHKNVKVVDWYKRSKGHTEYFASDGIHLQPSGVRALSDEITKQITQ